MYLSILIVNWRSAHFLEKCLSSIFDNVRDLEFEVIVIDNASFDGSEQIVAQHFPKVRFIQSHQNLGFAKANNFAFSLSSGKNVLFLNPDTEVQGAAIQKMCAALERLDHAGALGCKLVNSDGSLQTSCVQAFPSIWNQILDAELLRNAFPNSRLWGTSALHQSGDIPIRVEVISGACLLLRRDVFETIGTFSTDFFMYAEDVDLCFKAVQAGFSNYYLASATVVHHGGQSSSLAKEKSYAAVLMRESKLKFLKARRGKFYALRYKFAMGIVALCRLGILAAGFLITFGKSRRSALQRSFSKWTCILRWALGFERWAKNA